MLAHLPAELNSPFSGKPVYLHDSSTEPLCATHYCTKCASQASPRANWSNCATEVGHNTDTDPFSTSCHHNDALLGPAAVRARAPLRKHGGKRGEKHGSEHYRGTSSLHPASVPSRLRCG